MSILGFPDSIYLRGAYAPDISIIPPPSLWGLQGRGNSRGDLVFKGQG